MRVISLTRMPGLAGAYLDAALRPRRRVLPPGTGLPDTCIEVSGYLPDASGLAAYRKLCGYHENTVIPITYPFILMFPLQLALVTRPEWRLRVPGLVHLGITLAYTREIVATRPYTLRCHAGVAVPTDRGLEFEILLEMHDAHGLAWSACNRILSQGSKRQPGQSKTGQSNQPREHAALPAGPGRKEAGRFSAPARIGRRYARISGDWNPIHLGWLGARAFGFRRPIAHGMWTLARSLAMTGTGAGAGCTLDASFRAPLYLPGDALVTVAKDQFETRDARSGRQLITGCIRPVRSP